MAQQTLQTVQSSCTACMHDAKADLDSAAAVAMQKAAGVMEQANFDKMLDLLTRDPDIFKLHSSLANGASSDHSQSDTGGS